MDLNKALAFVLIPALLFALSACAPSAMDPTNPGTHNPSEGEAYRLRPHDENQDIADQMNAANEDNEEPAAENKSVTNSDPKPADKQTEKPTKKPATPPDEPTKVPEPETVDIKNIKADWDRLPHARPWTKILVRALETIGQGMILKDAPGDVKSYCPKWDETTYEQRIQFYVMLISSMVRFESSFNPEARHTEDFVDSSGTKVVSRGLLQISWESGNGVGCKITNPADLHKPEVNLSCGVRLMNRYVTKDNLFGTSYEISKDERKHRGANRYWAVLRRDAWGRAEIRKRTLGLKFCQ